MKGNSLRIANPDVLPGEPSWFCIRTHLKHEHIAAAHLRKTLGVIDVFNPQLRLLRSTRRGPVWCTESLFPNYLFARFVLESTLEKVRYTPAVKFVVRFADRVPEIPEAVIEDLRQGLAELGSNVLTDAPTQGEEVEIASGAFEGMRALVTHVLPSKQRVRILLDVMGRAVPAELSLGLVLFNRRNAAKIALNRAGAVSGNGPGTGAMLQNPASSLAQLPMNKLEQSDEGACQGECARTVNAAVSLIPF